MSKFKYLISSGHGGMIDGKYVTAPNKMFTFPDGFVFYEGVFNRLVAEAVCSKLVDLDIDHMYLHKSEKDIPSQESGVELFDRRGPGFAICCQSDFQG